MMTEEHKFPWKWKLSDLEKVPQNGRTVFSCFSCGGGSSMGYKLAGYKVIGNVEIDPSMNKVYNANFHPDISYTMDIRDFNKSNNFYSELKSLDVLDGSPPCSVFSTAGEREKGWGKEKKFREGQKLQKLDDLFFHFIETAQKLQPKVVVAENVSGLIKGNARGYVNEILHEFQLAGYKMQIFDLNAATMGVPQMRERIFFIGQREDMNFPKLQINIKEPVVTFGEVRTEYGKILQDGIVKNLLKKRIPSDHTLGDISMRVRGRNTGFCRPINHDDRVAHTNTAGGSVYRYCDGMVCSDMDFIHTQTFPEDYNFGNCGVQYICGMSVPPVMMAHIASAIDEQWFEGKDNV